MPAFVLSAVGLAGVALFHGPILGHAVAAAAPEEEAVAVPEGAMAPMRPNTRLTTQSRDGERVGGIVAYFSADQVTVLDGEALQTFAWADLDPAFVNSFVGRLVAADHAAGQLLAAKVLVGVGGEERLIERSLNRAEELDPELADAVAEVRATMAEATPEPDQKPAAQDKPAGADEPGGNAPEPNITNPRAWPERTEEQHAETIRAIESATTDVLERMGKEMSHIQTKRFIVYTDMERREAQYWISLVDKMYDRMCEVFDMDKEENIWDGKCLLMLFKDQQDYLLYNVTAYNNNATGSAGICYQFGSGHVHIAMYRQPDEKQLAHVLVHEASHGFLFRYQSSYHVPNWLNEGLAEYIANALVDSGTSPRRALSSRQFVKQRKSFDNFLSAQNIIGQHYGLAYDLTDLMVAENRNGYVRMIRGIKEGKTVQDAFKEDYGAELDRVLMYYLQNRVKDTDIRLR